MSRANITTELFAIHGEVAEMSNGNIADLLNAIGQRVSDIIGETPDDIYLYAEVTDGSADAGIFRNTMTEVVFVDPNMALFDDIFNLWYAAEPDKEWGALHYDIKDGRFDARFEYPDGWDPEEHTPDRRKRALEARFGDKPVIYPPPGPEFSALTEADLPTD